MATRKRTSASPAQITVADDPKQRCVDRGPLVVDIRLTQETIDRHELPFPPGAEDFIKGIRRKHVPGIPYAHLADARNVMGYIDPISDDWNATSSAPKRGRRRSPPTADETRIELILVDDSDGDNRCSFDAGSSTTLKALFNKFADLRGVSLRSLRFSYRGDALFLSSAGSKTPEELGLRDKDVIVVHDATRCNSNDNDDPRKQPETFKKAKAKKKLTNQKAKMKRKGNKRQPQRGESKKTLEEDKVEHSKQLTKIHGEAHDQFRQIRQRLNSLVIERSQPKIKSKRPRLPKDVPSLPSTVNNACDGGLGGKAGKSRYAIQVGEVENLYKTTKPSALSSHNRSSNDASSILDLHGCTKDEALAKLDDALEAWVDVAMRGSYPFVLPATIVCGSGNQILSETVREWIRSNDKVSNAPKVRP